MIDDHPREPELTPSLPASAPAPSGGGDAGAPPRWAQVAVYAFGATVGGAALLASGFDLYGLADALGFTQTTCVAVPVGLDAGASTTGVLWITAPAASTARRQWRAATLGLVGASAVLNGLSVLAAPHWLAAGAARGLPDVGLLSGAVAVVIAVVIAFAFPLVAAWMVHAVLAVRDAAARTAPSPISAVSPVAVPPVAPSSAPPGLPPVPAGSCSPAVPPAVPAQREEREERLREVAPLGQDDSPAVPAAPVVAPGAAGEQRPEEPAPPEPTGHKMTDARAWFRHERAQGRTPRPVEVNRAIGSDGYVKTSHIEQWERELADEPHEPHEQAPGRDSLDENTRVERLRLVDTR